MARGEHDEKQKKGGLFDDLSLPQIIAGALAAVTSMLLASQIGIYGSVIGVGVGSVVSAVASQLYKKFLQRSAEKLRELKPGETGYGVGAKAVSPSPGEADERGAETGAADPGKTALLRGSSDAEAEAAGCAAVMDAAARRTTTPSLDDAALQGDATARRVRAKREHKKKVERGVVIVSIVSAVLAVLVSGGVVYFATQGQGVGAKTAPIVSSQPKADSRAADGGGSPASTPGEDAPSNGSTDTPKDQSKTDGSKDASSGNGSSEAGDQQGSGSSGSDAGGGADSGSGGGSDPGTSGGDGSDPGGSNFGEGSSASDGSGDAGSGDSSGSGGSGSPAPSGSSVPGSAGSSSASDGFSASR